MVTLPGYPTPSSKVVPVVVTPTSVGADKVIVGALVYPTPTPLKVIDLTTPLLSKAVPVACVEAPPPEKTTVGLIETEWLGCCVPLVLIVVGVRPTVTS